MGMDNHKKQFKNSKTKPLKKEYSNVKKSHVKMGNTQGIWILYDACLLKIFQW